MRRIPLLILALACCLAGAAPALGAAPARLYDDCQDNGRIDGAYSQRDFRRALQQLPSDLDEYTDCRDVIRSAQLSAAAGGSGGDGQGAGGGAGGGTPGGGAPPSRAPLDAASPAERAAFDAARRAGGRARELDGELVRPGARGLRDLGGEGNALPAPVVVLLALLAAGLLAGGATATRTRLRARGAS
jgi:hypothetical protein